MSERAIDHAPEADADYATPAPDAPAPQNAARKRRPRETEPPKLAVPLVCRECGKETTPREGLVCDACYKTVFWAIFDYDDD